MTYDQPRCPKCGAPLQLYHGGERGETNAWLCTNDDCGWDSEEDSEEA